MALPDQADDVNQLLESDVAAISELMSIEQTISNLTVTGKLQSNFERRDPYAFLSFLAVLDVFAFYAAFTLIEAFIDADKLNIDFPVQIYHYSIDCFWMNISAAMLLVVGCMMENLQLRPSKVFSFPWKNRIFLSR